LLTVEQIASIIREEQDKDAPVLGNLIADAIEKAVLEATKDKDDALRAAMDAASRKVWERLCPSCGLWMLRRTMLRHTKIRGEMCFITKATPDFSTCPRLKEEVKDATRNHGDH